ncbi:hypothetical protein [Nocardia sp. BMG51109]|uniref:hypothetical protein n=1 Tax=Nocardia sp. BMG51109 TaxID=1056816 RepID=UPI0012EB520D|nr:hypothetical protein [Nocardia sp. BMG51109]
MTPIPIQVIGDSPNWWLPWIPFVASLVVAVVAFIGVLINNHTNRTAIQAADERNVETLAAAQSNADKSNAEAALREHDKWRRDSVLTIAVSALSVTEEVADSLSPRKIGERTPEEYAEKLANVPAARQKIMMSYHSLMIVSNLPIADKILAADILVFKITHHAKRYFAMLEQENHDEAEKQFELWSVNHAHIASAQSGIISVVRKELDVAQR